MAITEYRIDIPSIFVNQGRSDGADENNVLFVVPRIVVTRSPDIFEKLGQLGQILGAIFGTNYFINLPRYQVDIKEALTASNLQLMLRAFYGNELPSSSISINGILLPHLFNQKEILIARKDGIVEVLSFLLNSSINSITPDQATVQLNPQIPQQIANYNFIEHLRQVHPEIGDLNP